MVINKAAVVGAGLMGSGIARHMASHGIQVTLVDNNEEQLARAAQANENKDLQYTSDMTTINAVDYAIEAVFENLDVKRQVLSEISSVVSPDCLIASNTSSLLIGDLEKAVTGPNRFIGVHYNNPADINPVVEIIAGMLFGSMALLADGFHMATHTFALGITAIAYYYSRKHAHDPRYSFGTGKIGVLGGFTSAIFLAMVSFAMIFESIIRLYKITFIYWMSLFWGASFFL